ncbi:MAG: hydroxymethylglutaryl-CoA reductase, degradative [Myxococcales bacterium]|nr:hydroxymethylglutaryl-CoA reductase, degradative [Myxococcales bacterium]MCB9707434.1 hydroxymethylglutaryl-CoA reductase, degradative [Myxococcales bacterium]
MTNSRFPGFYKLSIEERRRAASEALELTEMELRAALDEGLTQDLAESMIENVLGRYALPFAVCLNTRMNGRDYVVPMVVEEPSVVAASSNAAKIVRQSGGFIADADLPTMIAQIQLYDVPDILVATQRIREHTSELLAQGDIAIPGLVSRQGGCRGLEVRDLGEGMLVVHVLVDCQDAMGANLVNSVAEALAPQVAALSEGSIGLRILSNLADHRCVRVRCHIPTDALAFDGYAGEFVRDGIINASRFAERDPYRAATHNKGIMNGVDAVVMATGNDWRAAEAGAHAFAARRGRYAPLSIWSKTEDGALAGFMELPLALGVVGGPARIHPGAQLALRLTQVQSAQELSMLAACAGMSSNLAALRALSTDGIQAGHLALHARSVARAAGARGKDVERVAAVIHAAKDVTLRAAQVAVAALKTTPEFSEARI